MNNLNLNIEVLENVETPDWVDIAIGVAIGIGVGVLIAT